MGAPDWVDVFPIKNGDVIPASYVSETQRVNPWMKEMFVGRCAPCEFRKLLISKTHGVNSDLPALKPT